MSNFVDKYAPTKLDEVVFPSDTVQEEIMSYVARRPPGHILLHGSFGTGKTSVAKLIPNACVPGISHFDVLAFDGSSKRSINDVRGVENFASTYSNNDSGLKFVFVDEAHCISNDAQQHLRGVIQKYRSICAFIFAANDVHKIDEGIQSRCRGDGGIILFSKPPADRWLARCKYILEQEHVAYNESGILPLIRIARDNRALLAELQRHCEKEKRKTEAQLIKFPR